MDIVEDLITRVRGSVAGIPDDALRGVEVAIRQDWGGTEPYVRKHVRSARGGRPSVLRPELSPTQREGILAAGLQQGKPLAELFREAGLCRSKGFKALAKRVRGQPRAARP